MTFGIDPAFFLSLALLISFRLEGRLAGLWLPILAHEAAHILFVRLSGARVSRAELLPFGLSLTMDGALSYRREIAAVAAGPAAHLASSALLWTQDRGAGAAGVVLALYNLLPLAGLDGGRILVLAFESGGKGETGRKALRVLTLLAAAAGGAVALTAAGRGLPFAGLLWGASAPLLRLAEKKPPLFRKKSGGT